MPASLTMKWAGMVAEVEAFRRTPGTSANTLELRCIPITAFEVGLDQVGAIEFKQAGEDAQNRSFNVAEMYVLSAEPVAEYRDGQATGRGYWKLVLRDRRYRWAHGEPVNGRWNVPDEAGTGVVAGTAATVGEIIYILLGQLGEMEFPEIPEGLDVAPPYVAWADADPRDELDRILEEAGLVISLGWDSKTQIFVRGGGPDHGIPDAFAVPMPAVGTSVDAPGRVIVTSAPTRIRDEIDTVGWLPVAEEADGSVVPVDDASYKPAGRTWSEEIRDDFNSVLAPGHKTLARGSVYKWFQCPEAYRAKLPMLEERSTLAAGEHAKSEMSSQSHRWDEKNLIFVNAVGRPPVDYQIDFKRGLVKFASPLGSLVDAAVEARYALIDASTVRLEVEWGFEVREWKVTDFYRYVANNPLGGDLVRVVRLPELQLYRIAGVDQNRAALDARAAKVAAAIFNEPSVGFAGDPVYKLMWPVVPSGWITEVELDPQRMSTRLRLYSEPTGLDAPRVKRALAAAASGTKRSAAATSAEASLTGAGSGARAKRDPGQTGFGGGRGLELSSEDPADVSDEAANGEERRAARGDHAHALPVKDAPNGSIRVNAQGEFYSCIRGS